MPIVIKNVRFGHSIVKVSHKECDFTHIFAVIGTINLPEQKLDPLMSCCILEGGLFDRFSLLEE